MNKKEVILAFTGNRPEKLPDKYDMSGENNKFLKYRMELAIKRISPVMTLSGCAQGVDFWGAELSIKLGIPFIACIPFKGQEILWPNSAQKYYNKLLDKAFKIEYISEPGFANWKYQRRNMHMVDSADLLLAVWDGTIGGTSNCIQYAKKQNKPIEYIMFGDKK